MTVLRYEPWAFVARLQKDIDRKLAATPANPSKADAWLPPVDILEADHQFLLNVDLPGVDPQAVEITSDQGVLTVSAKRELVRPDAGAGVRRIERFSGEFQRKFSLPETADVLNIKAKVVNGVLEVVIPKLVQTPPRRIMVEAA